MTRIKWLISWAKYARGQWNFRNAVSDVPPAEWLRLLHERSDTGPVALLWAMEITEEKAGELQEFGL